MTTSAFSYLSGEDRRSFVALLESASHNRRIAWLSAEGAGIVEALAEEVPPHGDGSDSDVLGVVTFDRGDTDARLLAFVHKHGAWMDWRAPL
jgi:hypothetical protein